VSPVVPAELAFAGDGTPFSRQYDDIYHSGQGGLEQSRHVFLRGNDLPDRWRGRERFVILETGFGIGLNFLATWQAWQDSPGPVRRQLHYVAVEKHPFRVSDLATLHARWPELAPLAAALRAQWPPALPGLHRIALGDITLTLALGDAIDILPQLSLAADAIYLDGFAPDRNPALWSEATLQQLRRLAAPGATLASWSVAGEVRRRLASADFSLDRKPGFGSKRDMLVGHLPGTRPHNARPRQRIAVIGAGIAGCTVAHSLAGRGHTVSVLDSAAAAACGASGNLAGVFRPLPSPDDGALARVLRAGFLHGRRLYDGLAAARCGWTGVLHLARDARHEASQREIADTQALPPDYCRFVNRDEAAKLAAWPVATGGWWFPQAGWINPPSLCRALLAGINLRTAHAVTSIERAGPAWRLHGDGFRLEADSVVVANGVGLGALLPGLKLPLRPARGQVSHLAESATPPLDVVVTRLGYATPAIDGIRCAGATHHVNDQDASVRLADHIENLFRLDMALPGYASGIDPASLGGRVSNRPMSPDRLPMVGPVPQHAGLWICNGFGARGLVFASICAELLSSMIDDDPLPLEQKLVLALDPARFATLSRRHRRPAL